MEDSDQVADGDPVGDGDLVGYEDPVEDVKQVVNAFHDVRVHVALNVRVPVGHVGNINFARINFAIIIAQFSETFPQV